jgi:hypothetical protein
MSNISRNCGCTESLAIAHAKALGLLQELQSGIYTCCQVAEWADEQLSAWLEATQQDGKGVDDVPARPDLGEAEASLVPARLRRGQVPWFRNPGGLSL